MADDKRVKRVRMIQELDLRELICETFGRKWILQRAELYAQNTLIRCEVHDDPEFAASSLYAIQAWLEDSSAEIDVEEFLAGLHAHGKLEAGELYIHIWW